MKQAVITPIVTLIVGFILGLLGDPIKLKGRFLKSWKVEELRRNCMTTSERTWRVWKDSSC